ncbi:polyphosphate polymerase domain-containing protein [Candidatus Nomurabacteria bacterium]|nr:polyphosphate polymerase domain-containing protein [Candidatus Nomurabacteria bacterium]USN44264.1 MAG: polyphosphate polymerase domain-containing protein [Candidatus Woesearchaeota archaeon]
MKTHTENKHLKAGKKSSLLVENGLQDFSSISLPEIKKKAALMERVETKYVMNMQTFLDVLGELKDDYCVLEVKGKRVNHYKTIYYDTKNYSLFYAHHNGELNRYKIRSRSYKESHLSYMEVKFKNNKNKTKKERIRVEDLVTNLVGTASDFVERSSTFDSSTLFPVLSNSYARITLLSKKSVERLTFDFALSFSDLGVGSKMEIPNLVIAEVKQEKFSHSSLFMKVMHKKGVRMHGFSKYCVGLSLLKKGVVKSNNFKEKLLLVDKVTGGEFA